MIFHDASWVFIVCTSVRQAGRIFWVKISRTRANAILLHKCSKTQSNHDTYFHETFLHFLFMIGCSTLHESFNDVLHLWTLVGARSVRSSDSDLRYNRSTRQDIAERRPTPHLLFCPLCSSFILCFYDETSGGVLLALSSRSTISCMCSSRSGEICIRTCVSGNRGKERLHSSRLQRPCASYLVARIGLFLYLWSLLWFLLRPVCREAGSLSSSFSLFFLFLRAADTFSIIFLSVNAYMLETPGSRIDRCRLSKLPARLRTACGAGFSRHKSHCIEILLRCFMVVFFVELIGACSMIPASLGKILSWVF